MMDPNIDRIMNTPDVQVDTERALSRIRERVERERIAPVISAPRAPRAPAVSLWVKGLAAAASVAIIAVLLTVSGVAETILTIFEPKQVVAVPITSSDFNGATGFAQYGTLEAALEAGRFATQAEELRLYRRIATLDASAPLPSLAERSPTWAEASNFAEELGLRALGGRLDALAAA